MSIPKQTSKGFQADQYTLDHQGLGTRFWRYSFWLITLFSTSVIVISAWFIDHNNNQAYYNKKRADVQDQLGIIRARLEGKLNSNIQAVNGLVAAISVEPDITQERFALLSKPLIDKDNQLRSIAGAPDMIISLMYPMKGNESAIGLNFLTNEKQRTAAITARDSGQLVLAGPVNLVQGGQGFIGRIPIYTDPEVTGKRRFWGLISAVINIEDLYRASGLLDPDLKLDIAIFGHDKRFSDGSIFYGNENIFTQHPVVAFIELPFGNWQLAALPKDGWPEVAADAWKLRLIMLIVALCILTPVVSLAWLSNQHRDQQMRLNALFQLSPMGIALNDFDTGEYIKVNRKLAEDTGYSLKQLKKLSFWDLTPKKYYEKEQEQIRQLNTYGAFGPYEKEYVNAQGKHYPVLLNGILIQDSKGKKYIWCYIENISKQKEAEAKLAENNKQLELIINATQVGIWDWEIQTGKLHLNERWAEIIGYKLEELGEISIETWLAHAHPDDLEDSGNKLEAHWQGKTPSYVFEGRMRHKLGHDIWILDTGKVIEWDDDGKPLRMVGTHLDITQKKIAEQTLAKTNESLATQMELIKTIASAQSDFIKNSNFIQAFENLLLNLINLSDSEIAFIARIKENKHGIKIQPSAINYLKQGVSEPQALDINKLALDTSNGIYLQCVKEQVPTYVNRPDLSHYDIHWPSDYPELNRFLILPIVNNHRTLAIIGLANRQTDYDTNLVNWLTPLFNTIGQIIERIEHIEGKRETELALIEAKNEAEAAGRAKTDFLATMSHEIRTPMNGVLGMLNLLYKSDLSQEQMRKVEIAKISADSLLSIINDILDFTKVESGKLELENLEFNIRETIDDICQSMGLRTQEQNLELIIDLSGLTHEWIISDSVRIRQILTNLIGNADKFTDEGFIKVSAKILKRSGENFLHCSINDTGIGISASHMKKLFSSFTQADASTTRRFGGTGLGLSICKRICDIMKGKIWVESHEGEGSTFYFELPIELSANPRKLILPDRLNELEILIIDSNEQTCEAIKNQLIAWGNAATAVHSAQQAIDLLNQGYGFDLILMDAYLKDKLGIELGPYIRQHHPNMDARLVLMTKVNQEYSDEDIHQAGFNTHFAKPVTTKDLMSSFESLEHHVTHLIDKVEATPNIQLPKNAKLLLVEDIPFNQEVALMLLAEMGATADVANNGQEAVDKVKQQLQQGSGYDVILMDCQMPIMDGYDASIAIREVESHTNHKSCIIAMTANALQSDEERCLSVGMDDYLTKPIDENKLLTTLHKWLSKST
ncbi:MAG: response regulator [Gammaproteobacteria bacterium]|nr:response regulator [Gammaproteobacteria bacterium]